MKKVKILTTGGTIASRKNEEGRLEAGLYTGEELASRLGLPQDIHISIRSVFQKPSVHITTEDIHHLYACVKEAENEVDGIVITHGTDTLEESAYFMSLIYGGEKPIVFTGSQRGPDALGSDAYINLRHACYTAAAPVMTGIGTVVVFNERIFSAKYVKKEHASNIQGFNAFGFGYLGIIDNDAVHLYQKPVIRECFAAADVPVNVELVKAAMAASPGYLYALIEDPPDGVVIEGMGRGQVPPSWIAPIETLVQLGTAVVLTTSAEEGNVYTTYEYPGSAWDMEKSGVILGHDEDSKKARMKLTACLQAGSSASEAF
ncbi:asparaginase [Alkalicoccus chagannorensis]|uniref:asparaginase n=1 Tax=Alkalicoccus chagannorensis TaxID=427072 RepID=UPI000429DB4B|nr:asparaginase [Alkalicoccus chagannorensis]